MASRMLMFSGNSLFFIDTLASFESWVFIDLMHNIFCFLVKLVEMIEMES